MTNNDASNAPGGSIEAAFAEFREGWLSGNRIEPDAFCKSRPDCGPELREMIDNFLLVAGLFPEEGSGKIGALSGTPPGAPSAAPSRAPSGAPSEDGATPIKTLGDFRLLREIGRGGMGVVYEAEQISLNRKVALKVLPSHLGFSQDTVMKFHREAEAGGRQRHPSIVAVHAIGEHEGVHFIAQELVEGGRTLEDKLESLRKAGDLPSGYFREVAQDVASAADALHHAHETGVIHRDVKPSNILLTDNGQPKITDFGLAKLEDALALSRTGDFSGTPYYMSPEQVTSRGKEVDRRTDIYSLGVTLYELLTLKRPFEGKSSYEVLKKIPNLDPPDPHKANPRVPRDLSTICLKAMDKLPGKRYQSMQDLADDLRRFLSGEVVLAKPAGAATRLMKRIRRNPILSGAILIALVAVLILVVFMGWSFFRDKIRLQEISRQSDLNLISRLQAEAEGLWPAYPERIPDIETWLHDAHGLVDRTVRYRETLDALGAKGQLDQDEQELAVLLDKLVSGVDNLAEAEAGLIKDVEARLQFAATVRENTIDKYKDEWDRAIASIADPADCPWYLGFRLDYQIGLVPLGQDPQTSFWEFALLQTGDVPERGADRRLVITEETALVFVLLPGGTFRMGAERGEAGAPNRDPNSVHIMETPIHDVTLDPFFMSKYEMTQGQWLRMTGENPSSYYPGRTFSDHDTRVTLQNPVELVSWHDCNQVLQRLNLVLPTEAQWEYACRAGTSTVWYTGDEPSSLDGYENLADKGSKKYVVDPNWDFEEWLVDGYLVHAPVGSFKANPFGLHDMVGNVSEWCRCKHANYRREVAPGDGERVVNHDVPFRVFRGGNWRRVAGYGRSANRPGDRPHMNAYRLGVRPAMPVH
jgi:formylglycine-generating enzyme required for sulfatase activity